MIDGVDVQWTPAQQHAAFTLFVEAASRVGQARPSPPSTPWRPRPPARAWACSSRPAGRLPPVDLQVREDLRTRLGWGLVHALSSRSRKATRASALQTEEAFRHGIVLGEDVLDYLLTRFARDLKSLMHLLHRLDGFALSEKKRAVTIPLLQTHAQRRKRVRMTVSQSHPVRPRRHA